MSPQSSDGLAIQLVPNEGGEDLATYCSYSTNSSTICAKLSNWNFKRRRLYILMAGIIFIGLVISAVWNIVLSGETKKTIIITEGTQDAELLHTAFLLNDTLDLSYNPCDNFYEFSCGGWIKANPLPSGQDQYPKWTQFTKLDWTIKQSLKAILKSNPAPSDSQPLRDAKAYFNKCVTDGGINDTILAALVNTELLELEARNESVELLMAQLTRRGYKHLIEIDVAQDNTTSYAVTITKSGLINVAEYKDYLVTEYEDVKQLFNITEALKSALILEMGDDFTDEGVYSRSYDKLIEIFSTNWTSLGVNSSTVGLKQFDWGKYFREVFAYEMSMELENIQFEMLVDDFFFLTSLASVLSNLDSDSQNSILRKFVLFNLVIASPFDDNLEESLIATNKNEMVGKRFEQLPIVSLFGQNNATKLEETCAIQVNNLYGLVLSLEYIQAAFPSKTKEMADEMVKNILNQFRESFEKLDWLATSSTKAKALEKLNALQSTVGYPDFIKDPNQLVKYYEGLNTSPQQMSESYTEISLRVLAWKFQRKLNEVKKSIDNNNEFGPSRIEKWITTPTVINAFYLASQNKIYLPAGILRAPFYGHALQSMNYGSLGVIIGHEITHAFDSTGRTMDLNGNTVDWWDTESSTRFETKAQCFKDQFQTFNYDGVVNKTNGVTTLGENIADSGGLRQAFYSYKSFIKKQGKPEPSLPGIPYNPEQLFFIATAQCYCSAESKETILAQIDRDVHTPSQARVLGMMSNMKEFYSAWNCPLSKDKEICQIW